MNRSESKYFNTALLMDRALVELLKEKDFEFITIKEICAKAGVNRTTFYLHYETIADLVNETLELTMKQFQGSFPVRILKTRFKSDIIQLGKKHAQHTVFRDNFDGQLVLGVCSGR